jgi:hypothetical protein
LRYVVGVQVPHQVFALSPSGSGWPATLTFAARNVGTSSPTQVVTLSNGGQQPLAITSIAFAGANPGDFARAGGTCPAAFPVNLAGGASCTVLVTFSPTAAGNRAAILRITDNHNATPGSTQDVALAGTGIAAIPGAGVTPGTLTFAARNVGSTSASQLVTLTNTGGAALSIASITRVGANPGDFARPAGAAGGTCPTVFPAIRAAGARCTVTTTFPPTAPGARAATLRFTDNAGGVAGSQQNVALTGSGIAVVPGITVNPTSQDFGNNSVLLGIFGVSRTFTVTSSGTGNLVFGASAASTTGINASQFTVTANTCSNTTRAPGATCSITVRFRAQAPANQTKTASLRIVSNAPTSPTQIPLPGRSTA